MPDRPVVALDMGVLLGLAGLDVSQGDALLLGPVHHRETDVFRAVVTFDRQGLSAPFDDLVQGADDSFGGQREVDLDAQSFTVIFRKRLGLHRFGPAGSDGLIDLSGKACAGRPAVPQSRRLRWFRARSPCYSAGGFPDNAAASQSHPPLAA